MVPSVCVGTCGDGLVVSGEACDDAPPAENGDGCSIMCTQEPGFTCAGMPSTCATSCGDGVRAGGEGCDDAPPAEGGDGCNATCFVEPAWECFPGNPSACALLCGNGAMDPGEQCDDDNNLSLDGCSATCRTEPREVEPNDDGVVNTGASGISGNDFDAAGGVAVSNAILQAATIPIDATAGSLVVLGAVTPAGDEDVFQLRNTSTTLPYSVRVDLWNVANGLGAPCPSAQLFDTGLRIKNAAGTDIVTSDTPSTPTSTCTSSPSPPTRRFAPRPSKAIAASRPASPTASTACSRCSTPAAPCWSRTMTTGAASVPCSTGPASHRGTARRATPPARR